MKQYRTYTIRLFPTKEQVKRLQALSLARNTLYNVLIDIEVQTYNETKNIKTEFDLDKNITVLRKEFPVIAQLNSKASQRVAKEIYSSYKSFFNLIKKDKTARPPRKVEDINRFHTIVYNQTGWKFLSDTKVKLNGITLEYRGIPNVDYTTLSVKEVNLPTENIYLT